MRSILTVAAFAVAAALIVPRYYTPMAGERTSDTTIPVTAKDGTVTVPRSARGDYQVRAIVDGKYVLFVVDTETPVVALSATAATAIGIHSDRSQFAIMFMADEHAGRGAPIMINDIQVGGISVKDVDAVVTPAGMLPNNVLGQPFLSRLKSFYFANDRLIMEPNG